MRKLSESRLRKAEKLLQASIKDSTIILELGANELELLLSASKSVGLSPSKLVSRLVKNWLNNEQRSVNA